MKINHSILFLVVSLAFIPLASGWTIIPAPTAIPTADTMISEIDQLIAEMDAEVESTKQLLETIRIEKEPDAIGIASWYSESDPGINKHTANGEVFDESGITCASWHYPFNTLLEVKNLKNNKSVVCRVNDRGPAKRLNRVIDLTKAAFSEISSLKLGLIKVSVTQIEK